MILFADSEEPDWTARIRRLLWAFTVRIFPKTRFRRVRPIFEIYFRLGYWVNDSAEDILK